MSKICFVADFFSDEVNGGGELNNEEFIKIATSRGYKVEKVKSQHLSTNHIKNNFIIMGNFIGLSEKNKIDLISTGNYSIYEHDHKYLTTRDPSYFEEFKAPTSSLCNVDFYNQAKAVFCQSKLHSEIVTKNLPKANVENLSGNLWDKETLQFILECSKREKQNKVSIWNSSNPIKNTSDAKKYCMAKGYEYDLIGNLPYKAFLSKMFENNCFVFFPTTVETLCRVVVEARMAGMKTVTNKKIGAISEPWFQLRGPELVEEMYLKRQTIPEKVLSYV